MYIYLYNISIVTSSMNTLKNTVQTIIFLFVFLSALLSHSPVFSWTWDTSYFPQLHEVRPANYFHSSGERWGVLFPSSTLQVWGSIVLLISTSAAPFLVSIEPPLWKQTCHNLRVWLYRQVTDILCLPGQNTQHPSFTDITKTIWLIATRPIHEWGRERNQ